MGHSRRYIGNGTTNYNQVTGNYDISSITTPSIFICSISNSDIISSISGNLDAISLLSYYDDTSSNICIGSRSDKNTYSNVYIGEALFYSGILSNTNKVLVESYLKSKWGISYSSLYSSTVLYSGATVLTSNSYTLYSFTSTSSSGFITFINDTIVYYLIVGGGGAGGTNGGGGGGAGGFISSSLKMTAGSVYSISIGTGGTGEAPGSGTNISSNGLQSNIKTSTNTIVVAYGGGRGASRSTSSGSSGTAAGSGTSTSSGNAGGSGGGGSGSSGSTYNTGGSAGTSGYVGGSGYGTVNSGALSTGGGGGGSSSVGSSGSSNSPGNGGSGSVWFISGNTYCVGGSGGTTKTNTSGDAGSNATNNTGNGGGGGSGGISSAKGGNGGSGIVIIAYTSLPVTTNLQLWLDPFYMTTNSSGNITVWSDRSTNSKSATIKGSPTQVSSGINSRTSAYITTINYVTVSIAAGTFSTGVTMFIVYKFNSSVTNPCLIDRTNGNLAAPWDFYGTSRIISNGSSTGDNNTGSVNIYNSGSNSIFIATITYTSSSVSTILKSKINGVSDVSNGSYSNYSDSVETIYIGRRADSSLNSDTYYGDIILYSGVLSDTNILSMETYLKTRWNISYTGSWTS